MKGAPKVIGFTISGCVLIIQAAAYASDYRPNLIAGNTMALITPTSQGGVSTQRASRDDFNEYQIVPVDYKVIASGSTVVLAASVLRGQAGETENWLGIQLG